MAVSLSGGRHAVGDSPTRHSTVSGPRGLALRVRGSASPQVRRALARLVLVRQVSPMSTTTLLPFQADAMSPAQLAAVSYLARYSGHTHVCTPINFVDGSRGATTTLWTHCLAFNEHTSSSTFATSAAVASLTPLSSL